MRTNVDCLTSEIYGGVGDLEGRLKYKSPKSSHRAALYDSGKYNFKYMLKLKLILFQIYSLVILSKHLYKS